MSFLTGHGSGPGEGEESDHLHRRSSRLFAPLSRFGRRRSNLSLRRHETEDEEEGDARRASQDAPRSASPMHPPDAEAHEYDAMTDADDAASTYSTDDESVLFTDDGGDDDDEDPDEDFDVNTLRNTLYNAHSLGCGKSDLVEFSAVTNYEDEDLLDPAADEFQTAPNIVFSRNEKELESQRGLYASSGLPVSIPGRPRLLTIGPLFERNRCTVIMEYGDYKEWSHLARRPKRYVVASDGSEGSQYAINWAMGTVLRDGDETLIVSVMETETKLDALEDQHEDPMRRSMHQRIRQDTAVHLAHQAFVLLQRTCLNVKVSCQALHARNARHMLLDLIDFYSPTMVIVGSRGIETIRGVLGSMSHYLVQKSSVPVMVAHNKLQLPRLPRGKADVVNNVRMRHMRLDQAVTEKSSNATDHEHDEDETKTTDRSAERNREQDERLNRLNRKSLERRKVDTQPSDAGTDASASGDPEAELAPAIATLSTAEGDEKRLHLPT